jgi:phosphoribosylcarboxyaminoimidazole (NCAIR) mutase
VIPSFVPPCVPSRVDPSELGHAATIYSSVQGPPGVETPTNTLLIYKTENNILLNQTKLSTTYTNNAIILRTNTITIKINNIMVPHINMKLMTKYNIPLIPKSYIH